MSTSAPTTISAGSRMRRKDYELTDDERALVARWLDPKLRREQLTSQIWGRDTLNLLVWPLRIGSAALGIVLLVSVFQGHLGWTPWVPEEDHLAVMTFVLVVFWIFNVTQQLLDQQITILKFIESRETVPLHKTTTDG